MAAVPVSVLFETIRDVDREQLEWFIGERLTEGGVWDAPRASDGITELREIERTGDRARLCGQIWHIDQSLHTFWLDLERSHSELRWTLYFDPLIRSPRRARNAAYALARPDEVEWRVTLSGKLGTGG